MSHPALLRPAHDEAPGVSLSALPAAFAGEDGHRWVTVELPPSLPQG